MVPLAFRVHTVSKHQQPQSAGTATAGLGASAFWQSRNKAKEIGRCCVASGIHTCEGLSGDSQKHLEGISQGLEFVDKKQREAREVVS